MFIADVPGMIIWLISTLVKIAVIILIAVLMPEHLPAVPFDDDLVTQFRRVAAGSEDTIHHIDAVTGQTFTFFTLLGEKQVDAGNLLAVITLERGLAKTNYFHVVVLLFVV